MFYKAAARQDSSFCKTACLNFRVFALRDIKIVARERCRLAQN